VESSRVSPRRKQRAAVRAPQPENAEATLTLGGAPQAVDELTGESMTGSGAGALEPTRVLGSPATAGRVFPAPTRRRSCSPVSKLADIGAPLTGPACCPAIGEMTPAPSVHHRLAGVAGAHDRSVDVVPPGQQSEAHSAWFS